MSQARAKRWSERFHFPATDAQTGNEPGQAFDLRRPAVVLLTVAAGVSAALLLVLGWNLTFFNDEWSLLLHRRGSSAGDFLAPHNEHLFVIAVAAFKAGAAMFGIDSTAPFRVLLTLMLTGTAVLLFVYVRRRTGEWLALIAAVVILFFGPGWQDLLLPVQITVVGSIAAGLGALLCLEREDRMGDVLACGLLVVAIAFSSLGLPFVAAAAVDLLVRREHWRARLYVPGVSVVLFMAWYAAYGHAAGSTLSLENILTAPRYLFDGTAASLSSLVGLGAESPELELEGESLDWGRPLLVVAVALAAWRLYRGPAPSRRLWMMAVASAVFWLLTGLNQIPGREPFQSRYLYTGAIFVILIAAELSYGIRIRREALIAVSVLAVFAVFSNLAPLGLGARFFAHQTDLARAELSAIEVARDSVNPEFSLEPKVADTDVLAVIDAGSYLSAVDAFGSPAYPSTELAERPESVRSSVDVVLSHALPIQLEATDSPPARGTVATQAPEVIGPPGAAEFTSGSCVSVRPGVGNAVHLQLPPGGAILRVDRGPPIDVSIRRFATDSFPVDAGTLSGGSVGTLSIPPDRATESWELELQASQRVAVCSLGRNP